MEVVLEAQGVRVGSMLRAPVGRQGAQQILPWEVTVGLEEQEVKESKLQEPEGQPGR